MITRRKLFAFSAAVAISPSASISASAEIPKVTYYGGGVATLEDVQDHIGRNYAQALALSMRDTRDQAMADVLNKMFREVAASGLKEFDGEYEPMQYYDSWQQ